MAMVNYPYPTNFLAHLPAWPLKVSATKFENLTADASDKDMLTAFFNSYDFFFAKSEKLQALDSDGWNYMACNEMVMPISQNGVSDMFWPEVWNGTARIEGCQ